MKKPLFTIVLLGLGAAVFAQSGILKDIVGTVELKPAGAAAFAPAQKGDTVQSNTIVSTGFNSSATILVGNSIIIVRPVTRLRLTEIITANNAETINVNLQAGRIRVDVKPPAGGKTSMKVQSLNATASVRGTEFEQDTRNLRVGEGTVAFMGTRGAPVLVYAGSESRVTVSTGKAGDPIVIDAQNLTPAPPATGPGSALSGERRLDDGTADYVFQFVFEP